MKNLDELQKTLLAVARRNPPSARVPYAFERRVMAQLRLVPTSAAAIWTDWSRGMWKAALSGLAVAVLLVGADGVLPDNGEEAGESLSLDPVEATVLASVGPGSEVW